MFGMLNPCLSSLEQADRDRYKQYYCGLCQTVGDDFGLWQRALQSSDAVFFAVFIDALVQQKSAASPSKTRCPIMPVRIRPTQQGHALRCASAAQMHLVDQKLADKEAEGMPLARHVRPVLSRSTGRAWEVLSGFGMDLQDHSALALTQLAVEDTNADPHAAAQPTASVLSDAFANIANLPDSLVADDVHRQTLTMLGDALGRTIYLVDALEDIEEDLRSGSFNPCIQRSGDRAEVLTGSIDRCVVLLEEAAEVIQAALKNLPLVRNQAVIRHIALEQLPARCTRAITRARNQSSQVFGAPWSLWRQGAHAAATFLTLIWVWMFSIPSAIAGAGSPMASNQCSSDNPCTNCCCDCLGMLFKTSG